MNAVATYLDKCPIRLPNKPILSSQICEPFIEDNAAAKTVWHMTWSALLAWEMKMGAEMIEAYHNAAKYSWT